MVVQSNCSATVPRTRVHPYHGPLRGLLAATTRKVNGEPINLGNITEIVSINEAARRPIEISGNDPRIPRPYRPDRDTRYAHDTHTMDSALDWTPSVPLD